MSAPNAPSTKLSLPTRPFSSPVSCISSGLPLSLLLPPLLPNSPSISRTATAPRPVGLSQLISLFANNSTLLDLYATTALKMSSPSDTTDAEQVRRALMALSTVVREMAPAGAKKIPTAPERFNLLARPHHDTCRICNLPGHHSPSAQKAAACRVAILSLIGFWEDVSGKVSCLYNSSTRFNKAITNSVATYEMRLDDAPLVGGDIEVVLVDRLTRNYLKFQSHFARIRAKANVILNEQGIARYEKVSQTLNGFFLNGQTRKSPQQCLGHGG